ncbi:hypothetical protein C7964_102326 [Loktanella sp. PT4BL]|jgi:hypothetical protein|nr:hypothetical protein C7964_102326 [Loktanella sp. PT4BL]
MNPLKDYNAHQRDNLPEGISYANGRYWFGEYRSLSLEGILWLKSYLERTSPQ